MRSHFPSNFLAASMLIRTMLRVNSDRRADIELIAGHWWLNFDQNLAAIQDLPENQVSSKFGFITFYHMNNENHKLITRFIEGSGSNPIVPTEGDNNGAKFCRRKRNVRRIQSFKRGDT